MRQPPAVVAKLTGGFTRLDQHKERLYKPGDTAHFEHYGVKKEVLTEKPYAILTHLGKRRWQ
jgi:hypothetical protein